MNVDGKWLRRYVGEHMENQDIFNSILRGNAVLITGSGAHLNVMTPHGEMFPSGVNLASQLYNLCGIDHPEKPVGFAGCSRDIPRNVFISGFNTRNKKSITRRKN